MSDEDKTFASGRYSRRQVLSTAGKGALAASVGSMLGNVRPLMAGAATTATVPKRGGAINVAWNPDPHTFNPQVIENQQVFGVLNNVMDRLLSTDLSGNLGPGLAKSWKQSPDGTEFTFDLVKTTWHDGVPFTSDDVVWFLQTAKQQPTVFGTDLQTMTSVSAAGPLTVKVTFSQATSAAIFGYYDGSTLVLPKHIYSVGPLASNPYNTKPVGTGPFKWSAYQPDQVITLTKNPHYFGGAPYLEQLNLLIIPTPTTALAELMSGQVDAVDSSVGVAIDDLVTVKTNRQFQLVGIPGVAVVRICFNFRAAGIAANPWISNIKVRQAIAHAIDRETITRTILHGLMTPSWGPYFPASPVYNTNLVPPKYDLTLANKLLDEAGYPRGANGTRFTCDFAYFPGSPYNLIADYVANNLAQIGINANLLTASTAAAYEAQYWLGPNGQGNVALAIDIGPTGPNPAINAANYDSLDQPRNNGNGVSIPEVDALFAQGAATLSTARQKIIYDKIQQLLADDLVNVWLGVSPAFTIANKDVMNLTELGPYAVAERWNKVWLK